MRIEEGWGRSGNRSETWCCVVVIVIIRMLEYIMLMSISNERIEFWDQNQDSCMILRHCVGLHGIKI